MMFLKTIYRSLQCSYLIWDLIPRELKVASLKAFLWCSVLTLWMKDRNGDFVCSTSTWGPLEK